MDAFGGLGNYKAWFILAYATSAIMNLCGEVARGMGEVKLIPICAGVSSVTTLVLACISIGQLEMGITGYFISVSVGPMLAIMLYMSFGRLAKAFLSGARRMTKLAVNDSWKIIRPMLIYALPLIPNNLFWWLSSGINRLFITGMLGIAASGMFAAASKIPGLLNTAYMVFQQAWQLSAYQESGSKGLGKFFSSVFCALQAVLWNGLFDHNAHLLCHENHDVRGNCVRSPNSSPHSRIRNNGSVYRLCLRADAGVHDASR